ncbi:MAG: hypothetical protein HY747_09945, partial [Elusimicrobia bacterium]|nr:hypothetical protein [Elusimicrobiota bacterium]
LAYDISNGNELLENLAPQISRPVYESEKEALQKLTDKRFFITGDDRCADWRTGIEILADVYDRLGLNAEKSHLVERAVKYLDDQKLPPGQDRNHDDNLRFFLELAGYDSRLRLFYPQLITAWPSDYVYPYRFAKYLLGKNKPEPALALISQAARLCYGANCLAVAKIQAEALAVMGRSQEAVAFLSKTIKDNKKVFPKETEVLETLYKKLK